MMACLSSTPSSFCCGYSTLPLPRRSRLVGVFTSCHSWSTVQFRGLVALGHADSTGSAAAVKKLKGFRILCSQATSEAFNHSDEPSKSTSSGLAVLEQFIDLNVGSWSGTFTVRPRVDAPFIESCRTQKSMACI